MKHGLANVKFYTNLSSILQSPSNEENARTIICKNSSGKKGKGPG